MTLSALASTLAGIIFVGSNRSTANAPFNPPARGRGPFKTLSEDAVTGLSNHSICAGLGPKFEIRISKSETTGFKIRCQCRSRMLVLFSNDLNGLNVLNDWNVSVASPYYPVCSG
jgi:hypothetical protein